ncbi:hypothetical protein GOP47_0005526 [Adiantum capillus-veneris]|uniref:Uncharacterized protein n=1 Tax=Adiantum capillus-veneris TaxID=13818 RepID=A0A9D4ZNB6_ADICA|nr:hypothetical protein GOP47_0005526 [Adiantum capillus-veneris]
MECQLCFFNFASSTIARDEEGERDWLHFDVCDAHVIDKCPDGLEVPCLTQNLNKGIKRRTIILKSRKRLCPLKNLPCKRGVGLALENASQYMCL